MFEGAHNQLDPSFCSRTGDAHFMYDFNGFRCARGE